jgi:hypothetical protein
MSPETPQAQSCRFSDPLLRHLSLFCHLATEICTGLRLAYPPGKGSEATRRTMLPNSRRVR